MLEGSLPWIASCSRIVHLLCLYVLVLLSSRVLLMSSVVFLLHWARRRCLCLRDRQRLLIEGWTLASFTVLQVQLEDEPRTE